MVAFSIKLDKKKTVAALLFAVSAVLAFIAVNTAVYGKSKAGFKLKNKSVEDYIASFGIEISGSAREDEVTVPSEFGDVYEEYNAIQKNQGFDLSDYKGKTLKRFTYPVKTESGDNVFVEVLLCDGTVVGADVYSTSVTGFMKALK